MLDREGRFVLRGGPLSSLLYDTIPSRESRTVGRWRGFDANGEALSLSQYPSARALRGETVTPGLDFMHVGDDGRETWFRCSAAPFRDEAGEIVGAVLILQDIDEEKRSEQRLRESDARLQAAVGLVNLGGYAWDPQTKELQWDDRVRAMWVCLRACLSTTRCGGPAHIRMISPASRQQSSSAPIHGAKGCTISSTG
jgi:PAS domain-containing protein